MAAPRTTGNAGPLCARMTGQVGALRTQTRRITGKAPRSRRFPRRRIGVARG